MDDNTAHLVNGTDINLCEETRVSPLRTACKIVHDSTVYNLLLMNGADSICVRRMEQVLV